jgi:multiple sugar transport system permease protein
MATETELVAAAPLPGSAAAQPFKPQQERRWQRRLSLVLSRLSPYLFVLPFFLVFLGFFVAPFVYDIIQSFYAEKHAGGLCLTPPKVVWVGFDNYAQALRDPGLWDGFRRVLIFGVVQIPIMMILALLIALLMDSAVIRFRRFFRLAAFVPYAVPGVVAAILWGFFYTPSISPIAQGFQSVNLPPPDFLGPSTILWSIANISTWVYMGYNMLIFFAAMQAIPQELYEAARIDGLTEVGIARHIKIPMIFPAMRLGLLFSIIGSIQLFNEPRILENISGAINEHFTPNIFAYNIAVVQSNYYYGGAIAAIIGLITFVFSFAFMTFTQGQKRG